MKCPICKNELEHDDDDGYWKCYAHGNFLHDLVFGEKTGEVPDSVVVEPKCPYCGGEVEEMYRVDNGELVKACKACHRRT